MKETCTNKPFDFSTSDEELYKFFLKEIYNGNLKINGMPVKVFTTPVEDNKMQGYFHITTRTEKRFSIRIRMKEQRAYYINHIPSIIKNYLNCSNCKEKCVGIKAWISPYKNTKRMKLLFSNNYNYMIVLEQSKKEWYIVTAYLIDDKHYLTNVLKEYNKYKKVSN